MCGSGRLYRCAQYVSAPLSGAPQVGRKGRLGLAGPEQQKVEKAKGLRAAVHLLGLSSGLHHHRHGGGMVETEGHCLD